MYDIPEEKQHGKLVPRGATLDYIYFHGNKRSIKKWVNSFKDSFSKHFKNIPFGSLMLNDEKLTSGYIIRDEEGNYSFTLILDTNKYYKI